MTTNPLPPTGPPLPPPPPGPPVPPPKKKNPVLIGLATCCGLLVLLVVLVAAFPSKKDAASSTPSSSSAVGAATVSTADTPTTAPAPTTTVAPTTTRPPKPKGFAGSGTLLVNQEIPPGRYRGNLDGGSCYWSRLSGLGQSGIDDIIANDNINGPTVIEIAPSDVALKSTRCGEWLPVTDDGLVLANRAPDGDGVFIVGLDIDPGTYRSSNDKSCYWSRLSSFSQSGIEGIIANDNSTGPTIVQIAPTDVGFKTSRCGSWTRIA